MVIVRLLAVLAVSLVALAACSDDSATDTASSSATTGGGPAGGAGGGGGGGAAAPTVLLPKTSITPDELGVLVNDDDPQSVEVGAYYAAARGIPAENVIHVSLPATATDNLPAADFMTLKSAVDAATPAAVQAYAVTWTMPTRVDCMSLTTALAMGYSDAFCNTSGMACGPTQASDYFDSDSTLAVGGISVADYVVFDLVVEGATAAVYELVGL
jgi:hypothetical protein